MPLGAGNCIAKNVDLVGIFLGIADYRLNDFFKIQEPEGDAEIGQAHKFNGVAETSSVFVVRVEQDDPPIGMLAQNLSQQKRHGA